MRSRARGLRQQIRWLRAISRRLRPGLWLGLWLWLWLGLWLGLGLWRWGWQEIARLYIIDDDDVGLDGSIARRGIISIGLIIYPVILSVIRWLTGIIVIVGWG